MVGIGVVASFAPEIALTALAAPDAPAQPLVAQLFGAMAMRASTRAWLRSPRDRGVETGGRSPS